MATLTSSFSKERMSIGQRPDNDIQVDHPTVSGQRADDVIKPGKFQTKRFFAPH